MFIEVFSIPRPFVPPDRALFYAETLLAAERHAEGLRRFRMYRELLQREFGVSPPEQLLRLTALRRLGDEGPVS
jgi:hypothetical protein